MFIVLCGALWLLAAELFHGLFCLFSHSCVWCALSESDIIITSFETKGAVGLL